MISMGCDMEAGAYGGPWIYKFHPYRGWTYNFAAGVGIDSDELTMRGVRFSSANIGGLCGSLPHWDCGYDTSRP